MSETPPPPQELLARAEDALRRAPVPEGPSEEAVARIQAALEGATAHPRVKSRSGRRAVRWLVRVAAVVVVGTALFFLAESLLRQPALAFGEVAQKLRDARSLAYRVTVRSPRLKEPESMRFLFKEPGLLRSEGQNGEVAITDLGQSKSLILDAATRSALLLDTKNAGGTRQPEDDGGVRWLERLRRLAENEGGPAGKRQVGQCQAQGFRVKDESDGFQDMVLWADPKTRLPVLIEGTVRVGDQEGHITFSDFEFNPVLDEALFRLEPPAGYVLRRVELEVLSPEDAVSHLLRVYAASSGGTFPARLDDWDAYGKAFGEKKNKPLDADFVRVVQALVRVMKFVNDPKGDYGYETKGVRFGDADKIIFWYRPQGSATCRVVYGDLRVGDVSADRLPEMPKQFSPKEQAKPCD
jgi:outer membrane lipoprotein-sorting protein